jgi:hypothetical protein
MKRKNTTTILYSWSIATILFATFYFMMPQNYDSKELPLTKFSTKRALSKVKAMTAEPHYVGSKNHETVAIYLQNELQNLGLTTELQEGFTMTEKGTLVYSKNILAKIKGTSTGLSVSNNSKALLLLSHYDSAPHSYSLGASDDASGVATILEGVRAFLKSKKAHKNDIIILFSDAEELGLNGATLFVTQHQWAKNIGVAINFEARGTSGPSYMLMETIQGNAKMVDAFANGKVKFAASNSLMYSIYKMLPNDTDLTVFRENGKIQGFNFAFIDNHFNYHTTQDSYQNLDPKSLAQQGEYLMPLLNYFANSDLKNLNTTEDKVYFTIPFSFLSYPFSWILPMLLLAVALFLFLFFVGLRNQSLQIHKITSGFLPFLASLVVSGLVAFFGWKLLLYFHPNYSEMLHGFTYNGHLYIYGFVSLTLAICFFFYRKVTTNYGEMSQSILPLLFWIILNCAIFFKLKGAGFFIIPVLYNLLMLGYFVLFRKTNWIMNILFSIPILLILAPFVLMFPIGLGLKILVGSAVLTVLIFVLLLPIFGSFTQKNRWSFVFGILALGFFVNAYLKADFEKGKAKPNSLLYVFDADTNKAYWTTYDTHLDEWTKRYLSEKPKDAKPLNTNKLYSKYGSEFTFMADAPIKNIAKPTIEFLKDSVGGNKRYLKIMIIPNRKVNRYDVFANGVKAIALKSNIIAKKTNKLLSYYVVDNVPLQLEFSINAAEKLDMQLQESSFDLITNPLFSIPKRRNWMLPKPFVLTDAIVIKQQLKPTPKL